MYCIFIELFLWICFSVGFFVCFVCLILSNLILLFLFSDVWLYPNKKEKGVDLDSLRSRQDCGCIVEIGIIRIYCIKSCFQQINYVCMCGTVFVFICKSLWSLCLITTSENLANARHLQGNKHSYLFFQSLILATPDPISKVIRGLTLLH